MKSGAVIEDKITFSIDSDLAEVRKTINDLKNGIRDNLGDENTSFQITFGYTIFRGKDISAVTFNVI